MTINLAHSTRLIYCYTKTAVYYKVSELSIRGHFGSIALLFIRSTLEHYAEYIY